LASVTPGNSSRSAASLSKSAFAIVQLRVATSRSIVKACIIV